MQSNHQGQIPTNRNFINQNFVPNYENSTSTKTFKQIQSNAAKSPLTSPRTISPLSQMLQIKNIKNDEFLFRMKLKFIACMQQLQISKEDIEALRKQQSDSDVLSAFINPVKKEFSGLKRLRDEYLVKENKHLSMKSIKSVQSLQMISLESQIQQFTDSQKKLKHRCQRLFTENAQLVQKLKKKQHEFEQSENTFYQTKLLLKEYESVIESLKLSGKKAEKDFLSEKDRLNEELNAFRELMLRQREAKQIYLSKLDHCETVILEKDDAIKRITDEVDFLKKQCIKWKNRSEWRQNQTSQESRLNQQKLNSLEQQIQKLSDAVKAKETQLELAKKQTVSTTEVFNKKLETIVEEWKAKLIDTIQEYEATIEGHCFKIEHMQNQVDALNQHKKHLELAVVHNGQLAQELQSTKTTATYKEQKITGLEAQLKETLTFYPQKVKELESIIGQLKSENHSKSISIDQSFSSLSDLNIQVKSEKVENQKLRLQLMNKQNELRKISEAKKDTENQLLKRISVGQNNRIFQISKLKVQYDEKMKQLEKNLKSTKERLQKYELQIKISPQKMYLGSETSQNIAMDHLGHQESHMKSSIPSVNNSFNTGLNDRANDRTNRLITETYIEPQKKSSVRRIFVRSNSINEYLKEKLGSCANEQTKDRLPGNISDNYSFSNNSDSLQVKKVPEQHP